MRPSGDFISLPVIARLNNSGQGITSSGFDGAEQQSHTGGKWVGGGKKGGSDKRARKGEKGKN